MNDLRSTARFVEREPRSSLILATLRDDARVADIIRHTRIGSTLSESAALSNRIDGRLDNVLRETVAVTDRITGRSRIFSTLRETAQLSDRISGARRVTADLLDSASLSDRIDHGPLRFDLRETATLGARAISSTTRVVTVREVFRARGRIESRTHGDLRDSVRAIDRAHPRARYRSVLRDIATVTGRVDMVAQLQGVLRSKARLRDRTHPRTIHRPTVRERAFISDWLEETGGVAWTANIRQFGMSRYDNYRFESVAGGFAAGPDGVFVRADVPVQWAFRTGKSDFGNTMKKRLGYVYGLGTHDAPLTLTVGGDVRGQWVETEHSQMARDATDDRVVRCKVGKGYFSNLFSVQFSGDAEFSMHKAEALLHDGSRRI